MPLFVKGGFVYSSIVPIVSYHEGRISLGRKPVLQGFAGLPETTPEAAPRLPVHHGELPADPFPDR